MARPGRQAAVGSAAGVADAIDLIAMVDWDEF